MRAPPPLISLVGALCTAAAHAASTPPPPPQVRQPAAAAASPGLRWDPRPAEPRDVVLLARWRNPDASIGAVQGLVPLPNLRGMTLTALGLAGAALAPGAPMDLVMVLNPEGGDQPRAPLYAFSVGVASLDAAQRAIREQFQGELSELQRGVWAVRLFAGSSKETVCLLGPAQGQAPLRLACGDKARDVNVLGPYLIRVLPQRDLGGGDLHAELRAPPAYQRYGEALRGALRLLAVTAPQKLQLGHAGFDRSVTDAVQSFVREVQATLADLDRATLDLTLSAAAGVELRLAYRLKGRTSWLARMLKEEAPQATAAPPLFFRLPRDSRTAYYAAPGVSAASLLATVETLRGLLLGYLAHEGLPEPDRKAIAELLRSEWPARATVWSSGPMDTAPRKGAAPPPGILGTDYSLGAYEGPPEPLRGWLQAAVKAYNRPAVQALLRKKLKALELPMPTVKALPLPKDLPAGSFGLQVTVAVPPGKVPGLGDDAPKGKAARPVPTTLHFLVVPEGERTWMGAGAHLPTVLRRLREQPKLPEDRTLAQREGLADLRAGRHMAGGFWTVGGAAEAIWRIAGQSAKRPPGEMARLLTTAPHHGETPMLYFSETRDSGAALDQELLLRVPRPSIEDIVSIVLGIAQSGGARAQP